jgi:hypothetical protein
MAASGRARRLSVDGADVVPGIDQRIEDRRSKTRRAHEDKRFPGRRGGHHPITAVPSR